MKAKVSQMPTRNVDPKLMVVPVGVDLRILDSRAMLEILPNHQAHSIVIPLQVAGNGISIVICDTCSSTSRCQGHLDSHLLRIFCILNVASIAARLVEGLRCSYLDVGTLIAGSFRVLEPASRNLKFLLESLLHRVR